jgi:hypothetical protein
MSDFFGKLKTGADKMAFEADKMSRLSRAKSDLEKIKMLVQTQYSKLGELYYNQRGTAGVTGPAFDEICQAIMDLDQQIESKNAEIQRISVEIYSPHVTQPTPQPVSGPVESVSTSNPIQSTTSSTPMPAVATTKFCPNCGKEMPVATKFCPDCGTKM